MKKILVAIMLFTVSLFSYSQAQVLKNSAIKLGGVIAYQVNNGEPRLGIGLGISKDLIILNRISIASELSYIQKGYTFIPVSADASPQNVKGYNKLEYLSLLIFGKLRIGGISSKSNSYLIGGLREDYFLSSTFAESRYKQTTFGMLGGIGGEIDISAPFKILIELVLSADLMRATVNTLEYKNTTIELKSGIKF